MENNDEIYKRKLDYVNSYHISQLLFSISQIFALIFCIYTSAKNPSKNIKLLLVLLSGSFIQSTFQFIYKSEYTVELSISTYIILEFLIQSIIINYYIHENYKKITSTLIYIYLLTTLIIISLDVYSIKLNIYLTCLPSLYIILFGIIAIRNLINKPEIELLFSFEFWIIYSFIFIHLCSLPIEVIEKYFLNKKLIQAKIIWVKAHQYTYVFYHIIIIYSLAWAKKKSVSLRQL